MRESPFDSEQYEHAEPENGTMELHCQYMMSLVALTEYNAKLIRIAAEMHDFAPEGALQVLKFYKEQEYSYSKLYDEAVDALKQKVRHTEQYEEE